MTMITTTTNSASRPISVPRPLVRVNQWLIVLSVVLAWATRDVWIMAIPFACGLCGLFLNWNPAMKIGRIFLRKPMSEYVPEDRDQRQFNQVISVVCLGLAILSAILGWTIVMYVFSALVLAAAFIAILGFCIGCFIRYQWSQYRYRRSTRAR